MNHELVWIGNKGMNAYTACSCGFGSEYNFHLDNVYPGDSVLKHIREHRA